MDSWHLLVCWARLGRQPKACARRKGAGTGAAQHVWRGRRPGKYRLARPLAREARRAGLQGQQAAGARLVLSAVFHMAAICLAHSARAASGCLAFSAGNCAFTYRP